jgi:flagellar motor switch protein FliM
MFEATFGECVERIQLALPYASVEGILRGLTATHQPAANQTAVTKRAAAWRPALGHIPIPLSVEWDACEITLREVVALQLGAVLRLPKGILQETHVRLGGTTKFIGEAGVEDGRLAIRIDQKLTTEEV